MKDGHVDGRRLRNLRHRRQMRQKDLADRAKVSVWHLSQIENDHTYCGDQLVLRLAAALGVDPGEFTQPGPRPEHAVA